MDIISDTLVLYGATLDDKGFICRCGRTLPVKVEIKRKRIRFCSTADSLIMSGPVTVKTVTDFVEKYWFWEKIKP